jgi:MFS family permease
MTDAPHETANDADRNWRRFVLFRVLFNSRFYYPVLAVLFLDLGLSATEYTLLNFAWALAIVFTDLPAGVLADRIGRRPLIVAAAASMIVEMILLCIAPLDGGAILFLCCLANRILSGAAEGMASGADEALVFDSLAERGREKEWPLVLDQVLRWQSLGFVMAMLVGGAVYDPALLNRVFGSHLRQGTTLRFPLYLNLLSAVATFVVAFGMREPDRRKASAIALECEQDAQGVLAHLLMAGRWILRTPLALFVIVAGLALDSVGRLFLTFGSSYFRLIHLPAATYGLIGAVVGGARVGGGAGGAPHGRARQPGRKFCVAGRGLARGAGGSGRQVAGLWSGLRRAHCDGIIRRGLPGILLSQRDRGFPPAGDGAFVQGSGLQSGIWICESGLCRCIAHPARRRGGGDLWTYIAVAAGMAGAHGGHLGRRLLATPRLIGPCCSGKREHDVRANNSSHGWRCPTVGAGRITGWQCGSVTDPESFPLRKDWNPILLQGS